MFLPKKEVYDTLKKLGYTVSQNNQDIVNEFPAITFETADNNVELFLNNEIAYQDVVIKLDIWADSSVKASEMLCEVEAIMRSIYYKLEFSTDAPTLNNKFHISTRFTKIAG